MIMKDLRQHKMCIAVVCRRVPVSMVLLLISVLLRV